MKHNSKYLIISIICLIMFIGIIIGVSYAFFNYTRTGPVNLLSTGGITFTSDYEGVTLDGVFPTSFYSYETDNDNVATIELNISGYTNYEKGLLYRVSLEDVHSSIYSSYGGYDIYLISVMPTSSGLENIELKEYDLFAEIEDDDVIAIGKIDPNTNVNGTITIKAFIPSEVIAISDTINYDTSTSIVPTDENGTTEEWVYGPEDWREQLTTSEWNSLASNPLSFKVKVETVDAKNYVKSIPAEIASQKNNITEVYFEKMDDEEIDLRYNAATYKADASIFGDGSVKAWIEGSKLYFASSDTIYLYDEFSFHDLTTYNISTASFISPITKIEFNNINTSEMTSMQSMFSGLSNLTSLDLSGFDTSGVKNFSAMFSVCKSLTSLDLSGFNTSNAININSMFNGCSNLLSVDLSSFDTRNVKNMSQLFQLCEKIQTIDLSSFDTSSVRYMYLSFTGCKELKTVYVSDLWTTENLDNSYTDSDMFGNSSAFYTKKIVGGAGTTFSSSHVDAEYARIDDPSNGRPGYFTYKAHNNT